MSGKNKSVIVVLGMHRGGTSCVARALLALGIPLGDSLLPPGDDNPTGFWEDTACVSINEELLARLHSAYDGLGNAWSLPESDAVIDQLRARATGLVQTRMAQHEGIWAFKDPRTSRLLRFWRDVLASVQTKFVIALRNPLSVALSFEKRNEIAVQKGAYLWLQHMLGAILNSRGSERVLVDYDALVDEPVLQLARLAGALGREFGGVKDPAVAAFLENFLQTRLRHTTFSNAQLALDSRLPEDAVMVHQLLLRVAKDEIDLDAPEISNGLEAVQSRLAAFSPVFEYVRSLERGQTELFGNIAENGEQIQVLLRTLAERETRISTMVEEFSRQTVSQEPSLPPQYPLAGLEETISRFDRQIESLLQRVASLDAHITEFHEADSHREQRFASLMEVVGAQDKLIQLLSQTASTQQRLLDSESALADLRKEFEDLQRLAAAREGEVLSLRESCGALTLENTAFAQTAAANAASAASLAERVADRDGRIAALSAFVNDRQDQMARLQKDNADLRASMSWRITGPLRAAYELTLRASGLFRAGRPRDVAQPPAPSVATPPLISGAPFHPNYDIRYVADSPAPPGFSPDVTVVAFYLPQFHPIPENDEWWGAGFTEWTNVVRARPQFEGHYQPHLPADLGFYDLRLKEVQARQVEMAKSYGIGAFCFYFYWFGDKTLLEAPIRQYLNSPELHLPFCLCWANESWSRNWNGVNDEVLIAQSYSPESDLAFIEHVGAYMRDPRYLRIQGRPVLLVYRPSAFPDIRATVQRWRDWAERNGFPGLYLIYPQSFDLQDPSEYGLDAAAEFPPNLSGPPVVTDQVPNLVPDFLGVVYDWRILVERSRNYVKPEYTLFRGVCPSWDNVPRRGGRGTVFVNTDPEAYREWVQNAAADTRKRLRRDERLIFANAWNEWAEGAHLEPDSRYGYAWLKATRDGLMEASPEKLSKVVVVTHDAFPHGGQFIALSLTRELVASLCCEVEVVCLGQGPLKAEFARYAKIHDLSGVEADSENARELAASLRKRGFDHALVNTTVSGLFLTTLKRAGLRCLALVHELKQLMVSYNLGAHARSVAENADVVVFPAAEVLDSFSEFATLNPAKAVVLPQGLLKKNPLLGGDRMRVREELRRKLGLADSARIVLGVGYGDLRKGLDYFAEIAARVAAADSRWHFVWVGNRDPEIEISMSMCPAADSGHLHLVGYQSDTAPFYAAADLFALTSREDPFPCVVLEAMDAGLPIVAFQGSGGSNRLIEEGSGQNVPMGDIEAFAQAVLRLGSESDADAGMLRQARRLIAERFSFRRYVFELLGLLEIPILKVSVVVPNFNYSRYLHGRISTILNQTYPIYEIVFLDDASQDDSVAQAGRLLEGAGVDFQIVRNDRNSGSAFLQWKLGIEHARGDFVWIAEADDLSDPGFLRTVVQGFEDPEVVLSYCQSRQVDRNGDLLAPDYGDYVADLGRERWQHRYNNSGVTEILNALAVKNTIPNVSAVLMRREKLAEVLAARIEDIRSYRVAGDWKTYLYLLADGRLTFFPQALNSHRRHTGGLTLSSFNASQFREIAEIQNWVASQYPVTPAVRIGMEAYLDALRQQFGIPHVQHEGSAIRIDSATA